MHIDDNKVYVNMLGEFKIHFQGITISQSEIHSKILLKYVAYLLYNYRDSISHQRMEEVLWMEDVLSNPRSTVKNLMYRLRKLLRKYWPDTEFWYTRYNSYQWNPKLELILDTERLDKLLDPERKATNHKSSLIELIELHQGAFLEGYNDFHWSIMLRVYYENIFFDALQKLCQIYDREGEYHLIELNAVNGMKLNTADELPYYWFIYACLKQNKIIQAKKAYEEAVSKIYKNDELHATERFKALGKKIKSGKTSFPTDINSIVVAMKKDVDEKAMIYPMDIFRNIFKIVYRSMRREKRKSTLLLLTVREQRHSNYIGQQQFMGYAMKLMERQILSITRASDAIAKYCENQFMILLINCTKEDANIYIRRLTKSCHENLQVDMNLLDMSFTMKEIG